MRLSEEIILGSTLLQRGPHVGARAGVGCVLQMAAVARGQECVPLAMMQIHDAHHWTCGRTTCPECGEANDYAAIIAMHLNDEHKWSIERIAQWVAQHEPSQPPEPLTATVTSPAENALGVRLNLEAVR